jgi:hypothetical protein
MDVLNFIGEQQGVIAVILTALLSGLLLKYGVFDKLNAVAALLQKVLELILTLAKAVKPDPDGKVRFTAEEISEIEKDGAEVYGAAKALFPKKLKEK